MPTPLSTIVASARKHLNEPVASFWSDAELLDIAIKGITDLWASVVKLNEEHFLTIDDTGNVALAASATQLSGVPTDVFQVHGIEPLDTTDAGSSRNVLFIPRDHSHPDFVAARATSSLDPSVGAVIYWCLIGQGSPINTPIVVTAPKITSAIQLRFTYVPTLGVSSFSLASNNPIPGESDQALVSWTVAFARVKEREDSSPDPGWLAIYATEKSSLLSRLAPRQTQELPTVQGVFETLW